MSTMEPGQNGLLEGQHAVVTGAGRGIGAAIATELARLGSSLTLMGRTVETLQARRDELEATFQRSVQVVVVDVTCAESVARAFTLATQAHGPPAILVNNAGGARSAPFARTDGQLWQAMIDLNLNAAYLCSGQVLPAMVKGGYGRVVNVASTAGLTGYAYASAYCAAKHGLIGLTRALARETARTGVTVNAVCPGYTDTDLVSGVVAHISATTGRSADQARAELVRGNPQGRLIQPAEVASAVGWLCLPGSVSVTGQSIIVAGGELM
jgi:NAD(P)-dependent dehydrogenase (short-subunit alcohol dehydrogenase family)